MRVKMAAWLMGPTMLIAVVSLAAPAGADGAGAAGGCPRGDHWNLAPIAFAIPSLDNGNYADQNGDRRGCYRVNKGQTGKHGVSSWTWKDNTNPS